MRCRNCEKVFCYGCGKAIDRNHTSEQCRLDQDQKPVRHGAFVKVIQEELTAEQSRNYPCPSCHQQNPKIGNNNHIFCWACQVYYCALCRKVVRKSSEHYGPRGCKQHTVDPEIPRTNNSLDDLMAIRHALVSTSDIVT
uniref:Uncharacterized protein n=1 Tax=Arundo donax TaxID=35708 RepID=A0A0A9C5C3_ARUDO